MVFTKPEEVDPDLISEDRLLDHVANDLVLRLQRPGGIEGHISEGVEGEFKGHPVAPLAMAKG